MARVKKTDDYRTPGPRDASDDPVKLDECGHYVLDFARFWEERLHPNSPESIQAYKEYNQQHRPQFRIPKFIKNWFNRKR